MSDNVESRSQGGASEGGQPTAQAPSVAAKVIDVKAADLVLAALRSAGVRLARLSWRTLIAVGRDLRWLFGLALVAMVVAAVFAPLIAPHDPLLYHQLSVAQPPSATYVLGTDSSGRDVLSRVIYGARISLSVGLISVLLGGIVDVLLAFPSLILALALAATLGASLGGVVITIPLGFTVLRFPVNTVNLVIALAVVRIPVYTRLARAQTLQVRSLDYVMAAHGLGTRPGTILRRHVLPNIQSALLVQVTISISFAILDESVLSFLGLGAPPPTAEWGSMISEAQPFLINGDPWMMLGPVLALILTVLSLNLFSDAVRERLDPRSADRGVRAN
jgi:peptide/nickel transport system permease protein